MSNRQIKLRSGGSGLAAAADGCDGQEGCCGYKSVDSDSHEDDASLYTVSSRSSGSGSGGSSSDGSGSSCDSSSCYYDSYIYSFDSCCGGSREGRRYEEVSIHGTAGRLLPVKRVLCCLDARPNGHSAGVVAIESVKSSPIQLRWTTSSMLCCVSILLGACSLSSLAACIAVTGVSLSCFELSRIMVAAEDGVKREDSDDRPQIDSWTERLMQPPLADHESSSPGRDSNQRDLAKRYSWDCIAQSGHTKCSPVQKAQSREDGARLSIRRKYHHTSAEFRAVEDGAYHISAQIAGSVWQPPPTLLRAVVTRIKPKSGGVNVTAVHSITGAVDGGASVTARKGTFSVYTAATMLLSAGDELQARIICVEVPDCVLHINGTASYLTLERL